MTIARGSWQQEILHALDRGEEIWNPVSALRGLAKSYAGRYQRSFDALLQRMESAGYEVEKTLGPRGGDYGATYSARRPDWYATVRIYDVWGDESGGGSVNNTFTLGERMTLDRYPSTDAQVRRLLRELGVVMPYQRLIFSWQDENTCYVDEHGGKPLCEIIVEKEMV